MDKAKIRKQTLVVIGFALTGVVLYYFDYKTVGTAIMGVSIFVLAIYCALSLSSSIFTESGQLKKKQLLPPDLPPIKDVESLMVVNLDHGKLTAVPQEDFKRLIKCVYSAKRINSTSTAKREVTLELHNKWNEIWKIKLIRTQDNQPEYEINRVYYGGKCLHDLFSYVGL